jgi:hypothetical protein
MDTYLERFDPRWAYLLKRAAQQALRKDEANGHASAEAA